MSSSVLCERADSAIASDVPFLFPELLFSRRQRAPRSVVFPELGGAGMWLFIDPVISFQNKSLIETLNVM